MADLQAPSERIRPISPRRSSTAVAMAAETANPAASSAAAEISHIRPEMRASTVPSVCSTRRTCCASAPGIASRIWYAMELA